MAVDDDEVAQEEPACDHHEHEAPEPAVWIASTSVDRLTPIGDLGKWCADHLGDGLDGFDGRVVLTHVQSL